LIGISVSQFDRDINVAVAAGEIIKVVRRGSCNRNDTNLWKLPVKTVGVGRINEEEKPKILNTSTTAQREVSREVSYARLRWERHHQRNHPSAMRRLYEENGVLQAENRLFRQRHDWNRERNSTIRAVENAVGTDAYYRNFDIGMTRDMLQFARENGIVLEGENG
jgi:hypothetical protein